GAARESPARQPEPRGMLGAGRRMVHSAGQLGRVRAFARPRARVEVVLEGVAILTEVVPKAGKAAPGARAKRGGEALGRLSRASQVMLPRLPLRPRPSWQGVGVGNPRHDPTSPCHFTTITYTYKLLISI